MTQVQKNRTARFAGNRVSRAARASRAALQNIEHRRILSSRRRLVVAGGTYELYEYERPYLYNRAPERKRGSTNANASGNGRRADNLSVARSKIRRLIAANEGQYGERLKFITFTFAKNVRSLDEAHKHWGEFARKMRDEYGSLKYLAVVEFQKRGAVHYHVLYFNLPYIRNAKTVIASLWGQGFVKIITTSHVRNLGAYVSKYLQKDIMDKRLVGEKAYFCSKALIKPLEIRSEDRIDKFLASSSMSGEVVKRYPSNHYGAITYTQGKIQT